MRVNEGKLATVMICNPRQIFGGLWSFSSIVFYISLYLSPKSIYQVFTHYLWICCLLGHEKGSLCNNLDFCESSDIGVTICGPRMMVTEDILGAGVTLHLLLFRVIYYYHNALSLCRHGVFPFNLVFVSMDTCIIYQTHYCPCSYCSSCSRSSNLYELIHRKEFYSGAGQFQGPGIIIRFECHHKFL